MASAAGSACSQRMLRLTVAAPTTPASTTQPSTKSTTLASPRKRPSVRPAARKALYKPWFAIIGAVAAANSGVVPKVRRPNGRVPQEALEDAKVEVLERDQRAQDAGCSRIMVASIPQGLSKNARQPSSQATVAQSTIVRHCFSGRPDIPVTSRALAVEATLARRRRCGRDAAAMPYRHSSGRCLPRRRHIGVK